VRQSGESELNRPESELNKRAAQLERFIETQKNIIRESPTDTIAKRQLNRYQKELEEIRGRTRQSEESVLSKEDWEKIPEKSRKEPTNSLENLKNYYRSFGEHPDYPIKNESLTFETANKIMQNEAGVGITMTISQKLILLED